MTIDAMLWAIHHPAELDPMQRLALIGVAALDGSFTYAVELSAADVAEWAHQPLALVEPALVALERAGLWWAIDGTDMVIFNEPGWERIYDDWVRYSSGGSQRQPVAPDVRRMVMERDGWQCQRCSTASNLSIDHKWPVARGGTNIPQNLQVLCLSCNSRKGDKIEVSA